MAKQQLFKELYVIYYTTQYYNMSIVESARPTLEHQKSILPQFSVNGSIKAK